MRNARGALAGMRMPVAVAMFDFDMGEAGTFGALSGSFLTLIV
jgi:hypothetical protein